MSHFKRFFTKKSLLLPSFEPETTVYHSSLSPPSFIFIPISHTCEKIEGNNFDFCSKPALLNSSRNKLNISKCFFGSDFSKRSTHLEAKSKSSSSGLSASTETFLVQNLVNDYVIQEQTD